MSGFRRGSTPRNTFRVNIDLREATVYLTYEQNGRTIVEKTNDDLTITEKTIVSTLSQKETLRFKQDEEVEMQIRYVLSDGTADVSNVMKATAERVLKEGEIEYV